MCLPLYRPGEMAGLHNSAARVCRSLGYAVRWIEVPRSRKSQLLVLLQGSGNVEEQTWYLWRRVKLPVKVVSYYLYR